MALVCPLTGQLNSIGDLSSGGIDMNTAINLVDNSEVTHSITRRLPRCHTKTCS